MSDPSNKKEDQKESALSIQPGVDNASSLNPEQVEKFRQRRRDKKRKTLSVEEYAEGIQSGDRSVLSKAITLIESSKPEHREKAQHIIEACLPEVGKSVRIGITGVPGVGKSTFIESLGAHVTGQGHKLAVLAIDPSSTRTKGSILGDKTRMEELAGNPDAFIRPSPTAGSLGGVARKTRETIFLCEAAGYDTIFIETVGVGQSETTVHSMVDFFLLLMIPGAGDELQGIKRGIMEMADTIVVNKADGNNVDAAKRAVREYKNALHLFPPTNSGWRPKVKTCSAIEGRGIDDIWSIIEKYLKFTKDNDFFYKRRREQAEYWMYETINNSLQEDFYRHPDIREELPEMEKRVLNGEISSFRAAKELLDLYREKSGGS